MECLGGRRVNIEAFYPVLSMDYLKIFNPLDTGRFQFLTGGWRGFKNEAGKMIGSHQMSTKARDAYDAARKEGKPDEMRKIAEEQNQIRKDREAAKVAAKTEGKSPFVAKPSNDRAGQYDPNINLSLEQRTNLANDFLAKGGTRKFMKAADKHANGQVREYWKKGNYVDASNRLWAMSSNGKDFLLIGQYDASGKIQFAEPGQ